MYQDKKNEWLEAMAIETNQILNKRAETVSKKTEKEKKDKKKNKDQ